MLKSFHVHMNHLPIFEEMSVEISGVIFIFGKFQQSCVWFSISGVAVSDWKILSQKSHELCLKEKVGKALQIQSGEAPPEMSVLCRPIRSRGGRLGQERVGQSASLWNDFEWQPEAPRALSWRQLKTKEVLWMTGT